ncbi:MDR family MFS transporter [Brochothrix campestris]|uniref:EmrB/QacA family drug resistance transporter n=1 Tax=Brochothrix campestris FSL F6-1037 TaxID=1265861 RepID=W7CRK3_9LIST|nr:MDR family MFS transporter [Brochothrix campestris]EUJ39255.1 EmrB/QacA family drug resistance transporter [Brochothrix campestris FSL F6-1037]
MKKTHVKWVTVAIFVSTFMTAIEGTIVSTAVPRIVSELNGISIMNWVFSIYLLTSAVCVPIFGKLADIYGRKPIFIIGTIVFMIGSALCGFAQDMTQLIIYRAIQGIGAGSIMPLSFIIIADIYSVDKRAKIMGLNGAAWGIAGIFGPLLGGFIVDYLTWHWIFFINVPIGIILIILMKMYFHEEVSKTEQTIDYIGTFLLTIGLVALLLGFQLAGDTLSWLAPSVLIAFAIALVFLGLFVWQENRTKYPILPLPMFKNSSFTFANCVAILASAFLIGVNVYMPMWVQGILGLSATIAGFTLAPMSITWILGSFIGGKMIENSTIRRVIGLGTFVIALAGLWLMVLTQTASIWLFLGASAVMGLGFGITITMTTITAQNVVAPTDMGSATSVNTLFRTLGQVMGMAVFGTIFNSVTTRHLADATTAGVTHANLTQLLNPNHAPIAAEAVAQLKHILFSGLHTVFIAMFIITLITFIFHLPITTMKFKK